MMPEKGAFVGPLLLATRSENGADRTPFVVGTSARALGTAERPAAYGGNGWRIWALRRRRVPRGCVRGSLRRLQSDRPGRPVHPLPAGHRSVERRSLAERAVIARRSEEHLEAPSAPMARRAPLRPPKAGPPVSQQRAAVADPPMADSPMPGKAKAHKSDCARAPGAGGRIGPGNHAPLLLGGGAILVLCRQRRLLPASRPVGIPGSRAFLAQPRRGLRTP